MAAETETPRFTREAPEDKPVADLVRDLSTQVSTLVRQELELAKAEVATKGRQVGIGAGMAGAGGLVALFGAGALVAAAILGLSTALDGWLAALVVGAALLAVAGVLAMTGIGKAKKAVPPMPERAIASSKQDVETAKHAVAEGRS